MAINIAMAANQITLYTLVDITSTGVIRSNFGEDTLERNQQRNWETVLQVLGLRTQPIIISGPVAHLNTDLAWLDFGELYEGTHTVWSFVFTSEQNVYQIDQLEKDFEQIPIVSGLTETAKFLLPIFYPHGTIKNVYFKFNP